MVSIPRNELLQEVYLAGVLVLLDEPSDDSKGDCEIFLIVVGSLGCPLVYFGCFAMTISLLDAAYSLGYALKKF